MKQLVQKLDKDRTEVIVAILLGFTALLMACVTFFCSSYEGQQATNYAESNNYAAYANSAYNTAVQQFIRDGMDWNNIVDYRNDIKIAEANGNDKEADLIRERLQLYLKNNISPELKEAIEWAEEQGGDVLPFEMEEYGSAYMEEFSEENLTSLEFLEEGRQDLVYADKYSIVSVLLSLVLFLLGIVGILKNMRNRRLVLLFAVCLLAFGVVYMSTIPLPF